MKKKKLKSRLKSAARLLAGQAWANAKWINDLTMLQVESDQKSADIEQLQADFCAEVTELNELIETQRQMLGVMQTRINDLMKQNTRLLARGGEWVPIDSDQVINCASGDGYRLSIMRDGEYIVIINSVGGRAGFRLAGHLRICRKVQEK